MTFLHPEFLYLMLPVIFVLFYFLLTQREMTSLFFSTEVFEKLRVNTGLLGLRGRNVLFLLMFIFLVIALAQPVVEEGHVKVEAKSADIMIALDISDSMLAEDIYPSRLEASKRKILELLDLSPRERLGVSAFARASYLVAPLSFDHSAVRFLVKQLQPSYITEKGTDFMQLLRSSAEMLRDNENKYLLILTDGGDQNDFSEEIDYAKEAGIRVFVLAVGTEKGAPIRTRDGDFVKDGGNIVVTRINPAVSELATETGGVYIEAVTSSEDIRTMFAEISAKTQKRTLQEEEIARYYQIFYYPLGVGMLLFLIATSSMTVRKQVHTPHLLLFGLLLALHPSAEAGLLDFTLLDEGREAYEAGDYNRSAALYGEYASRHRYRETLYNLANAQYKSGAYAEAASTYEKVRFHDDKEQFKVLHNKGNAYAKAGDLPKAAESYEKALKIHDDPDTRANLEAVKKRLPPEQKQQQPQQGDGEKQPKQPDQQGQQQDQEKQKGDDKKGASDAAQNAPQQTSDAKGEKNKPGEQGTPDEAKDQKPADAPRSDPQQKSDAGKSGEEQEGQDAAQAAAEGAPQEGMSDMEAAKWLKALENTPVSHIYKIGPEDNEPKESDNAKPW